MNFQQLRTFRELTQRGFSLTAIASTSATTQPGLTRQIRDLESELGLPVFERQANRIVGLTAAGRSILQIVDRLLAQADQLLAVRDAYATARSGTLVIAATHTPARYVLPDAIVRFRAAFPDVRIELRQCATEQIEGLVAAGAVDIGIGASSLAERPELATFPCYSWRHHAVVRHDHPLVDKEGLTLRDLVAYPILTYDQKFAGRRQLDEAFTAAGLTPDIVLTSMDSDVIKQYVALDYGVGLLTPLALDELENPGLRRLDTGAMFGPTTTVLALRRGAYIRSFVYEFIQVFLPELTRARVDRAVGIAQVTGGRRRTNRRLDGLAPASTGKMGFQPHDNAAA